MASFQRRGTGWRAIVRKKGHPSQSKTFSTKARAQAWAKKVEGEIESRQAGALPALTIKDALQRHLAHLERTSSRGRKNQTAVNNLCRGLDADALVAHLEYTDLAEYCATRIHVDGVRPATVKSDEIGRAHV